MWVNILYITIWLINISLSFYAITLQRKFYNHNTQLCQWRTQRCCVFLQKQLQLIIVQEYIFGGFAIATPTFGLCTSPADTFPFTYHFPSVYIHIIKFFKYRPICAADTFQRFQRHINILNNPRWRKCSNLDSHTRLSPMEIYFGVDKIKHIFFSSSLVPSLSSKKWLKTQWTWKMCRMSI